MARITQQELTELETRHEVWSRPRSLFNSQYEDIKDLCRPNVPSFHSNKITQGQQLVENIFDSTATWANEQLAAGVQGNMFPVDERWFELTTLDGRTENLSFESQKILERWADEIYYELGKPITNFDSSTHEVMLDLGAFGTSINFMGYSQKNKSMIFNAIPLAQCTLIENDEGQIDALDRDFEWTKRKILAFFNKPGDQIPKQVMEEQNGNKEFKILHATFPRTERDPNLEDKFNKPFASIHWIKGEGTKGILREGGFDYFPWLTPRWTKIVGETYGRSPAMNVLPDIRLLNLMMREFISAAQLNVRAPIVVEEDGFLPPVDYKPGSIIYKTPGAADPTLLQTAGNFNITLEVMDQKREAISRGFFIEFLLRPRKTERQTATEILDIREEMFRQIGPIISRLEREYAIPLIENTFFELNRQGRMDPPNSELQQTRIKIGFTSQAAKAQLGVKAGNIQRFIEDVVPLLNIDPAILKGIDFTKLGTTLAMYRNVPFDVRKSDAQIAKEEQDAQEAQQAAVQAEQGQQIAGSIKDIATAQEKGLSVV